MVAIRREVEAPAFTPAPYGLLSVAQQIQDEDAHWRLGISYRPLCGRPAATWDECIVVTGSGSPPEPPAKTETHTRDLRGATAFEVYAEMECTVVGAPDGEAEADIRRALTDNEAWRVERAFWTGRATDPTTSGPVVVYPHLAANGALSDPQGYTLQTSAAIVTGGPLDIVEGFGALEAALAGCYGGVGVIHVPVEVVPLLAAQRLIEVRNGQLRTMNGNLVAAGGGYPGTGPDGTRAAGTTWVYATGAVFYYRGDVTTFAPVESLDRRTNTLKQIAERPYVVAWDCCHLAIQLSTGGAVSGTAGLAT